MPVTTEPGSALLAANIKHLRETIELEANCSVSLQEDEGEWFASANRYSEFAPSGERTVANALGKGAIEALDKLAARLGVDVSGDRPALSPTSISMEHAA